MTPNFLQSTLPRHLGPIYQIAYVVPKLEPAIHQWVQACGAGPFFVAPHFTMTDPMLYGSPAPCDVSIALGFSGGLCIELIEQHDDNVSVYRECIESGRYGFHHVARLSDDLEVSITEYTRMGIPCVLRAGVLTSSRLAYLDARVSTNGYLELVSNDTDIRSTLKALADAAKDWDFARPIRDFAEA